MATDFVPVWSGESKAAVEDFKSPEGNAARDALTAAKAEERSAESLLTAVETDAKTDFGPDGAFWPLKGTTLEVKVNQYTYKVEPFGDTKQDFTSLGVFSGWAEGRVGSVMKFTEGARCWNGPARSLTITWECGESNALLTVQEDEKCVYSGRATSPAACDGKLAQELKLELEDGGAPRTEL